MAITTLDGVLAGMQYPSTYMKTATPTLVVGRPHSLFYLAGMPGAAVASSAGVNGEALTAYAGQLPFTNPVSGNSYLARFNANSQQAGTLILCDRLWQNSGLSVTSTSGQTVNSVTWPARDVGGATSGNQVIIGLEVTSATGAGAPILSMSYTNQDGTGSKTGGGILTGVASSAVGAFYPMGLAAGDKGVQSIQSFTLSSSWTSGAFSLVAYRELARLDLVGYGQANAIDAITGGFSRLYDNTVPFLIFIPSITVAAVISGQFIYTQG